MDPHQAPAPGRRTRAGQRRFAEQYSGAAILILCLGLGAVLFFAGGETAIPGALWLVLLVVCVAGLFIAGDPSQPRRRAVAAYSVSAVCSWILIASLPPQNFGMLVVLLVVVAAVGSYVLPLWATGVVIALNMTVVLLVFLLHDAPLADLSIGTIFYTIIHIAAVLSTYALYRESMLRAELEEKNVELETAGVLLEDSAKTAERLRISRELHDAVGHQLTVLNLELEAAAHRVEQTSAGRDHVQRAQQVAKELLAEVRGTVGELRRRSSGDLQAHLRQLADAVPSMDIYVSVESEELPELDEQRQEALLRAAQEIITNAVRHAEAQELALTLSQERGEIVLRGTDDGFPPKTITFGNGLSGLQERVRLLGGELQVSTRPEFTVEVRLP